MDEREQLEMIQEALEGCQKLLVECGRVLAEFVGCHDESDFDAGLVDHDCWTTGDEGGGERLDPEQSERLAKAIEDARKLLRSPEPGSMEQRWAT